MSTSGTGSPTILKPCIAEILRTGHFPRPVILQVERILIEPSTEDSLDPGKAQKLESTSRTAYRLLLTDGELSIQAAVHREFHLLLQTKCTREGQLIVLQKFQVCRAPRLHGLGEVVFLGVDEYQDYDHDRASKDLEPPIIRRGQESAARNHAKQGSDEFDRARASAGKPRKKVKFVEPILPASEDDEIGEDAFESSTQSAHAISRRRQVIREMTGRSKLHWVSGQSHVTIEQANNTRSVKPNTYTDVLNQSAEGSRNQVLASEESHQISHEDLPLHDLASLLDSDMVLPRRNYKCKVFAVVSWVSSAILKRPGLPEKRHIKVHDPSIARRYSGISISVFVNARRFRPRIGTIALFTGLTAQRWEGEVILNAYEKDCTGIEWFVDDESKLVAEGLAVEELKSWWRKRIERIGRG